jgi:[acyl-carrier-protein] S-malonyltransferase
MSWALLFPGQGSQQIGMGADVLAARSDLLGEAADEVLGWPLRGLCLEGPESALVRTDRAQPALFAVSFALWDELRGRAPHPPAAAAGHSLGEYTALAAAGAISFVEGLRLVAARGRAMAAAAAREESGMAALLGGDRAAANALVEACRSAGGRLWIANINAPGQIVIAGGIEDVSWAADRGRDHGIRKVVPLKVAGAFHTPLMEPALEPLRGEIDAVRFEEPRFPVWANVDAMPHGDEIGRRLLDQLTSPVDFASSLQAMHEFGVRRFVHVGPGDVTAGLARRSVQGAETFVVSSLDDVDAVAAALRED